MKTKNERCLALAEEIAAHLGFKVCSDQVLIIGSVRYDYAILLPMKEFQCFVHVSTKTFRFAATHQRLRSSRIPKAADFCVAMKQPMDHMYAKTHLPAVSEKLGIAVYAQPFFTEAMIDARLLTKQLTSILHKIDFPHVMNFFLSPVQLEVTAALVNVTHCTEQVQLLCDLITTAFKEGHERGANRAGTIF